MDYGVFDEASRDHDAEVAQRRQAMVRIAVSEEVMPFLALATSDGEYAHRRALAEEHLARIAEQHGAPLSEVTGMADRLFKLFYQASRGSVSKHASTMCEACGHKNTDHSEGLRCPCGCTSFQPESSDTAKEGRRVTAEEGDGPF
jgi:hypothetical protein